MLCPYCGRETPEGSAFCVSCGAYLPTPTNAPQQPAQPIYQQPAPTDAPQQPAQPTYPQQPAQPMYQQPVYPQQPYQQPMYQQPMYPQPVYAVMPQQLSMAWFKFLIYFALFAGAVLNLISGFMLMAGAQYDPEVGSQLVYETFPGMQIADWIYGLGCLALAVFGVVTRFSLSGYRAIGPKLLIAQYISTAALEILYLILTAVVLDGQVDLTESVTQTISGLVGTVLMIVLNIVYFNKRKHLFIN